MAKLLLLLTMSLPMFCIGANADIAIGQVVSVTSPLVGEISSELKSGFEAYFAELNEQGGIDGRKVRLMQKEDAYVAAKTLALTRELIGQDKVVALAGYLGTPGLEALVKANVLTDNRISLVGPATGVARLLNEKNVFPIRASYESELAEIVAHAKAMQHRSIAFVAWNAGAGPILAKAFPAIAADGGMEVAYQAMFDPSADARALERSLDVAIAPLQTARPDALVLVAGGNAMYAAVRQVRSKLGAGMQLYTISAVNWKDLVRNLGVKQAQGIMISQAVPYPYSPRLPIVKTYLESMRRLQRDANYYSFEGYLGAAVLAEALRKASPNITRESVTASLNNLGRYQLGGFEVLYHPERRQGFVKPDTTLITSRGELLH